MTTAIDLLIERHDRILAALQGGGEISDGLVFEDSYKKLLILACGSFFESHLVTHLNEFARSAADPRIAAFVRNKALSRQYHTLFDWDGVRNVNRFLALFGDEHKKQVVSKIASDPQLEPAMHAFLLVGAERNRLAHGNLAALSPDLTVAEIKEKYRQAWLFLQFLCSELSVVEHGVADEA